jgi:hypothetical protein
MFNNSLFNEEAKHKIAEREHEAETYRLQKQLGYADRRVMKWIFGLMTLIAAITFFMALL